MAKLETIEIDKLQSVKVFADKKGKTTAWVYHMIKHDKLDWVKIDGIKFIVVNETATSEN